MHSARTIRVRRSALWLSAFAAAWAGVIAFTGGVSVTFAGVAVSSHATLNPILLALMAAAIAVRLARPAYRATLAGDVRAGLDAARRVSPATYVLAGGIALRIWFWQLVPPLWLDEEMIALNIRGRSLTGLAGELWLGQAAPFGWLVLQRLMGVTLGFSEWALRLLPLLFGVSTIVAAWWAGRRWLSTAGAAAFVFLAAAGEWMFHFSIELKHYSADTFFGLLLPALVVWALEGPDPRERLRRAAVWWAMAIAGQAFSMGGLLVAPACAVALVISLWRRDGVRSAAIAAAFGGVWLACFGLHYAATLRFAAGSQLLQQHWSNRMAPEGAGLMGRLTWLFQQAGPLAESPGGARLTLLFWAAVVGGFAAARPRRLGLMLAAVLLSAAMLGLMRVVPLYDRFAIWALPAIYFGIALALDAAIRWARPRAASAPLRRVVGAVAAVAVVTVCADVGRHGYAGIFGTHHRETNHALDDRGAVEWLAAERRPGDAFITTHLGAPAVWWYADVPLSSPSEGASFDGSPIFELELHAPNARCDATAFDQAVASHTRVLIYLGFEDLPDGAKPMVIDALRELGTIEKLRTFGNLSVAGVIALTPHDARASSANEPVGPGQPCFSVKAARRW